MRNVMIAVVCGVFLVFAQTAFASGDWDPCDSKLKYIVNECGSHPDAAKKKMVAGVGADIPLIIHEKMNVDQETRFNLNVDDFGKDDISTMTVFKPQLETGILQTAWGFLAGLNPFNRGE